MMKKMTRTTVKFLELDFKKYNEKVWIDLVMKNQ